MILNSRLSGIEIVIVIRVSFSVVSVLGLRIVLKKVLKFCFSVLFRIM